MILKPIFKVILLIIFLLAGWLIFRQKKEITIPGPEKNPGTILQEDEIEITGKVLGYGSNHKGDIDKISISTNDKNIWLHFPPHTARQVIAAAPINSFVSAKAHHGRPPGPASGDNYELVSIHSNSHQIVLDLKQIPAPAPRQGLEIEFKGIPQDFSMDETGAEPSFILAGKIVSIPPHMAQELFPLIKKAKLVLVKGYLRDTTEGFVKNNGRPVIKPNSIQLDSVTYVIR